MFEMLGNWSFGDYFKKEAIEWALGITYRNLKIDKDRLYVTVFEGNKEEMLHVMMKHIPIGKNVFQNPKKDYLKDQKKTISGRWVKRDHADHVQKYILI